MNWQPIETAPKDGAVIDIWSESEGRLCNYAFRNLQPGNEFFEPRDCGPCCIRDATHWMPLPHPPGTAHKSIMHCQQCGEIRLHDHQCTENNEAP